MTLELLRFKNRVLLKAAALLSGNAHSSRRSSGDFDSRFAHPIAVLTRADSVHDPKPSREMQWVFVANLERDAGNAARSQRQQLACPSEAFPLEKTERALPIMLPEQM